VKTRDYRIAGPGLRRLVGAVRAATRQPGTWEQTAQRVAVVLRSRLPGSEILTSEQRYGDPLHFRSHLLHAERDGSFSVQALVLRPGQVTSVHDHVAWCVTAVLEGFVQEERFELGTDGWLEQVGIARPAAGEVALLVPPGDVHRARNPGPDTAIWLHICGTDVARLGSSVRRVYQHPIVAG
jgi:3-mercaptopropionate dioxygenase